MILADTSIWIEYLKGSEPYLDKFEQLLEERSIVAAEWIFGELLQGVKTKQELAIISQFWENIPHIEIDNLWVRAGLYSYQHKLLSKGIGLIDAVTIFAARESKAQIWTLDKKLKKALSEADIF